MKKLFLGILFILISVISQAAGESDAASSDAGAYLAQQGRIIPASEIRIDSYIAHIDYDYPRPEKDLGISFLTGNPYFYKDNTRKIFQVGIQGAEYAFEDLPSFNLCFVIDCSGSMAENDKIILAIKGLKRTIAKLRYKDRIALIKSGEKSGVILSSILLDTYWKKKTALASLTKLLARGNSEISSEIKKAYQICQRNYIKGGVNRIILLSDGNFPNKGLDDLAKEYKEEGTNLTTIGFGKDFNSSVMVELAKSGGGSSRFVSNDEQIEEHFYTDFDRMIVPVARNLKIDLNFLLPIVAIETWGYRHQIQKQSVHYSLPTLHHRDYETILCEALFEPLEKTGTFGACELSLNYQDINGKKISLKTNRISLINDPQYYGNERYVNPFVLKSSLMLMIARNLIRISEIYSQAQDQNTLMSGGVTFLGGVRIPELEGLSLERNERLDLIDIHYEMTTDIVLEAWKAIHDAEERLGENIFGTETSIMQNYLRTLRHWWLYENGGNYVRVPFVGEIFDKAAISLLDEILYPLPGRGSILFPDIINSENQKVNRIIKEKLENYGYSVYGRLPASKAAHYREPSAALMAAKAYSTDYILIMHRENYEGGSLLYGKIIDAKSGKVLATSQKNVY